MNGVAVEFPTKRQSTIADDLDPDGEMRADARSFLNASRANRTQLDRLASALINPIQNFDEPLAVDPKKYFVVLGIV